MNKEIKINDHKVGLNSTYFEFHKKIYFSNINDNNKKDLIIKALSKFLLNESNKENSTNLSKSGKIHENVDRRIITLRTYTDNYNDALEFMEQLMLKAMDFLSCLSVFSDVTEKCRFEIAKKTDKEVAVFDTNTHLDKLWFETVIVS